jgi:hypothetical protein
MPVSCTRDPSKAVGLVRCFGTLTEQDFQDSIRCAFGSLVFEPGLDRIVTLDRDVDLHLLDAAALRRICEHIVLHERSQGRAVRFRSVLVPGSDHQQPILSLYKATWDALRLPGVDFFIVPTEEEAWEKLNLPRAGP